MPRLIGLVAVALLVSVPVVAQYPQELPPIVPPLAARTPLVHSEALVAGGPIEITIAQAATPAVLAANGGLAGVTALAARLVAALNLAWSRDPQTANLTARLVAVYDIRDFLPAWPVVESGHILTDLDTFASQVSYSKSPLAVYRAALGADLMLLLTNSIDACGVSYEGPAADVACGAVSASCAEGNWSWAHEIGHLFGLNHNVGDASACGPTGVGYGGSSLFRTIMSYTGGPRTGYYSDPDVIHEVYGVPVGTSATQAAACLATTAPTVAAFRASVDTTAVPAAPSFVQVR